MNIAKYCMRSTPRSERLGALINDLLVLARADEEQMSLDHEPVRLDLLAAMWQPRWSHWQLNAALNSRFERVEPATVSGDTARLIQVLMGLVDNALTYTNAGGTVALGVEARGAVACLTVRDTGIGISEEDSGAYL